MEHRRNRFRIRDLDLGPRQPSPVARRQVTVQLPPKVSPMSCSGQAQDHGPRLPKGPNAVRELVGEGHCRRETRPDRGSFRGSAEGISQSNPGPCPLRSFGAVRTDRDQVHGEPVEPKAAIFGEWMPELTAPALRAPRSTVADRVRRTGRSGFGHREAATRRAARAGSCEHRAGAGAGPPGARPDWTRPVSCSVRLRTPEARSRQSAAL